MVHKNLPLHGYTILITRPEKQSEEFISYIKKLGGSAVSFPMIEIMEPDSWDECDKAIINIKKYDGIIFTSSNAVRGFFSRLNEHFAHTIDIIRRRNIYAVGKKTKETIESYGIPSVSIPDEYTADAIARLIIQTGAEGKTFLLPAGNLTRDVVDKKISDAGGVVDRIPVYVTKKPENIDNERLRTLVTEHSVDMITFFSPSSVHHFFGIIDPGLIDDIPVAAIGDTTSGAVLEYGIQPSVKPNTATVLELVDQITNYLNNISSKNKEHFNNE